jgi:hypothetical protein
MQRSNRVLDDSPCHRAVNVMQRCFATHQYDQSRCQREIEHWEDCVKNSDREMDMPTDDAPSPITPLTITDPRTPIV